MRVDELDYVLPEDRIAISPAEPRDSARLLVFGADSFSDHVVSELGRFLPPSLLVVNDTRVLAARVFGEKPTGGKVEFLLVERLSADTDGASEVWLALARSSKPFTIGGTVRLPEGLVATVVGRRDDGSVEVRLPTEVESYLDRVGAMPLPPYIDRPAEDEDRVRYQTVFARELGAIAAPTAGLHFTEDTLERLRGQGHAIARVTLHVGPGTFKPVKVDDLDAHPMHDEAFAISDETADAIRRAKAEGRPVVAIGTTVVRALESAADEDGSVRVGRGRTRLLIQPPYRFRVVDGLFTNFHLPRSTLLALVMALAGVERTRAAYAHAIANGYRFYSYGDAMLIPPEVR